MTSLKPGELKILAALEDGEKRFKDLNKTCVTNPNILSAYLKNLQKQGLVTRSIDTRKFQLVERGWETLYLADIHDLIEEYGLRKANSKLWGLDVIVSENTETLKLIDETLKGPFTDVHPSFSRIDQFLFHTWRDRVLASFSEGDRRRIGEYEDVFKEAVWLVMPQKERVSKEESKINAEEKLRQRYPGVEIPEEIIQLEAANITKISEETEKRIIAKEIGAVENLKKRLLKVTHLTEEDKAKLKPFMEYLEDPENIKVHKTFLKKLRECPKMLIIFSSAGFSGYLERYWQLFPNKEKAFKKEYPSLYTTIRESSPPID